jgi:hypothetical protein
VDSIEMAELAAYDIIAPLWGQNWSEHRADDREQVQPCEQSRPSIERPIAIAPREISALRLAAELALRTGKKSCAVS